MSLRPTWCTRFAPAPKSNDAKRHRSIPEPAYALHPAQGISRSREQVKPHSQNFPERRSASFCVSRWVGVIWQSSYYWVGPTAPESSDNGFPEKGSVTEHADAQKANVRQQWAAMRRRQYIAILPFLIFFGSVSILARKGNAVVTASDGLLLVLLAALGVGTIYFSLQNWRCPACSQYLTNEMNPRLCSKCGVALR